MSDSDSFIQEVSEEVRRDRMFRLWRRYAPAVLGGVVLVVGATAFNAWRDHSRAAAAQEMGARMIAAGEAAAPAARAEAFLALADAADGGAATLARLRAAAELAAAGDAGGAAQAYGRIAEAADTEPAFAAFAAYRAAVLAAPQAGAAATIATLTPLTAEGGPFRLLALEARAAAHLALGDRAAARADLDAVAADPLATENLRARAREALATLGAQAVNG
ncbi:MAG: tetratricopeptide repeat protein [Rhodobacterales bacterium]|nr:tetratricopeptide repeat protein [Rhodobacterales bacterium]